MDEYKDHLRRLAVHDDALLEALSVAVSASPTSVIDEKTAALVRVAATIAVDAAPVTGAARVVQCAPKVALALGYDVDDALEQHDGP